MNTWMRTRAAAGAVLIGMGVALPDYVSSPFRRMLAYLGLMSAGVGAIALTTDEGGQRYVFGDDARLLTDQLRREIGDIGVATPGPASDTEGLAPQGPLRTWLFLAAFVVFLVFSVRMDMAFSKWLAGKLRRRGVARPYTAIGVIYAALTYATFEMDIRSR